MKCLTLEQIFVGVPKELFTRKITAGILNRSNKLLGNADVVVCRNGNAYCVKGDRLWCGRVFDGNYWPNEGA